MKNLKKRGQSLVEFALILPILLMLLLGIAEGAHVIQSYLASQHAVREAARYAVSGRPLEDGNPWTETDREVRAGLIKDLAIKYSTGTGYRTPITDTNASPGDYTSLYHYYRRDLLPDEIGSCPFDDCDCDDCDGVLTTRVGSWDAKTGQQNDWGDPGWEGDNVRVQLYNNVSIFDPIYASIAQAFSPGPFVRISSEIVMRNEGGPPITGDPEYEDDDDDPPGSGQPSPKAELYVQGGEAHPAGTDICIIGVRHTPNTQYNIYLFGAPPGYPPIATVESDASGSFNTCVYTSYTIPVDTLAGTYTIASYTTGDVFKASGPLNVSQSIVPAIVTGGDVWPLGSPLEYRLVTHPPLTTTPGYIIEMVKGGQNETLPSLSTDGDGNSITETYDLDSAHNFSAGDWIIQSIHPSTSTTPVATRTLTLTEGCIKIDQSDCGGPVSVPAGVYINILLEKHAPNRKYALKFDGNLVDNVNTDSNGNAYLVYEIPIGTGNGTYLVISEDGGNFITEATVEVSTPADSFIHVDGGYTWPAGTNLLFQLRQHTGNAYYDIYWEGTRVIDQSAAIPGSQPTNGAGMLWLDFDIPVDAQGIYHLQSHLHTAAPDPNNYTAISRDIEVTAAPYIEIPEGVPQIPGAPVTLELRNHAINGRYDVYVLEDLAGCSANDAPGRKLVGGPVSTDLNGNGDIPYNIPSSIQGWVHIRSYVAGTSNMAADFCLELLAADLIVTNIETPDPPIFNAAMPITVTVKNISPVTITHRSFDVDVYLDPPNPPNLGRSLPPGDIKTWLQPPLAYNETRTFTTPVYLFGSTDHTIWARADTSARIAESNEDNNLLSTQVFPATCGIEYVNDIADAENTSLANIISWDYVAYGDALAAPADLTPRLRMVASGQSTWRSDDNAGNSGFLFAYRAISGDFEVQTRLTAPNTNATKWGIEVRSGTGGTDAKMDWGYHANSGVLQAQSRQSNGARSSSEFNISNHPADTPIWVRLVKTGNRNFSLYSASDNGDGTHGAWTWRDDYSNNVGGDVLIGLFASAYDGGAGILDIFDFNYFRICVAGSDCSAGNILYEPTYDGAVDAGWTALPFGNADTPTPTFTEKVPSANPPNPYEVIGSTVIMTSAGSSTWGSNDDNGGYLFVYHPISGSSFDVRVRAVDHGNLLNEYSKFGLQVRAGLESDADKIYWNSTAQHGLQRRNRQNGSSGGSDGLSDINLTGHSVPVWLRIVRNGQDFTLYYSYDSANPPNNWTEFETLSAPGMGEQVYIGLMNASYSSEMNTVSFDRYHVCGNPGGTANCGEVREAGGAVVINADNYITKHDEWFVSSRDGKTGLTTNDTGRNYNPAAGIEIEYAVDFTNGNNDYYVWILGSRPNNGGNSVHIGSSESNYISIDFTGANDTLTWSSNDNFLRVDGVGAADLSVWMQEDGFEIYQILLTTDQGFDPAADVADPNSIPQSQCSSSGTPSPPPGTQQCASAIVNGDFEDSALMSEWHYASIAQQVTRTSSPHYFDDGSFSMALPATNLYGLNRHPWLWQEFKMPTWVITPTINGGTSLNLTAHAAVNPEGATSTPSEAIFALLRDQAGQPLDANSVTGEITFTTDAQMPSINPSNPSPNNREWKEITVDLAQTFNPPESLLAYRGQNMRLFFESPNAANTFSAFFYLDNVDLEVCTTQPRPDSYTTKIAGEVLVFIDGVPTLKPGVFVWIYAIDGVMEKSYTIQDSTFSFYDLPADSGGTQYVLYAEYLEDNIPYIASTVLVLHPGETIDNISLLLIGGN